MAIFRVIAWSQISQIKERQTDERSSSGRRIGVLIGVVANISTFIRNDPRFKESPMNVMLFIHLLYLAKESTYKSNFISFWACEIDNAGLPYGQPVLSILRCESKPETLEDWGPA